MCELCQLIVLSQIRHRYNNFMITSTAISTASNASLPISIDDCYERTERIALFEVVEVS